MNTPRNGSRITKMIHSVFMPPPMSCRRNRSPNTVIRSQNQMIQAKKISIVHKMSRNG